MSLPPHARIMGLDLRPDRFGWVVLEARESLELLDWGVSRATRAAKNINAVLVFKRLGRLVSLWRPSSLVLTGPSADRSRKVRALVSLVRNDARRNRISLRVLGPEDLARAFRAEKLTKRERAAMLTKRFPVLHWKLPPPRKSYESEHYWMSTFDAAACALAYAVKRDKRFLV